MLGKIHIICGDRLRLVSRRGRWIRSKLIYVRIAIIRSGIVSGYNIYK